jgi:hypothetical protein
MVAVGAAVDDKHVGRRSRLHWWIHDAVSASKACGNGDEWTMALTDWVTVHVPTLEQHRRGIQAIKSPTAPVEPPTTAPILLGKGRVRVVRQRVETLSTAAAARDWSCDEARRAVYSVFTSQSSWTPMCRDYVARHKAEWACQLV